MYDRHRRTNKINSRWACMTDTGILNTTRKGTYDPYRHIHINTKPQMTDFHELDCLFGGDNRTETYEETTGFGYSNTVLKQHNVFTKEIEDLLRLGVKANKIEVKNDNILSSKSIVITGSFNSIARSQLKEELIRLGARVTSSVSSKTDFLVAGDKPGSKLSKAQDLGINILDEEEVLKVLDI